MFRFDLVRPCGNCPFRCDIRPFLNQPRAKEIIDSLENHTFPCHKTTGADGKPQPRGPGGRYQPRIRQHCAGALIIMERLGRRGRLQQIAERLGIYDPAKLDLEAPVYSTPEEFIDAQPRSR